MMLTDKSMRTRLDKKISGEGEGNTKILENKNVKRKNNKHTVIVKSVAKKSLTDKILVSIKQAWKSSSSNNNTDTMKSKLVIESTPILDQKEINLRRENKMLLSSSTTKQTGFGDIDNISSPSNNGTSNIKNLMIGRRKKIRATRKMRQILFSSPPSSSCLDLDPFAFVDEEKY